MTISFETSEVWHPTKLQELSPLQFVAWVLHRNFRALICEVALKKFWPHWDAMIVVICDVKRFRLLSYNFRHQGMPVKSCWFSVGGEEVKECRRRFRVFLVRWITCNDQHWKSIYLITIIYLEKRCSLQHKCFTKRSFFHFHNWKVEKPWGLFC